MKSRLRWLFAVAVGVAALLLVVAAFVLPRLVDPESYRALLRSKLEQQLGRDVQFGAMELSLWPVLGLRLDDLVIGRTPAERFDKPIVAESLRVGARLFPLLRGRLEVTSMIVDGPVLTLYRRDDGTWEPALTPDRDSPAPSGSDAVEAPGQRPGEPSKGSSLVVEQLRVRRARVVLRHGDEDRLRETALDGMTLSLDMLGAGGAVAFDLSTQVATSGTLRGTGTLRPATATADRPLQVSARFEIAGVLPSTLREWLAALAPSVTLPDDLLAERPLSAGATIDYTASRPALLAVSNAVLRKPGLDLVRSASGAWNYESLAVSTETPATSEEAANTTIHLSDLTIEEASISIADRSARGTPATMEILPLRVEVRQPRQTAPIAIDLTAAGGVEGRAALKGQFTYDRAKGPEPGRIRGELTATGVDPRDLRLATTLASVPAGLVVGRPFAFSAELDATLADSPEITLRNVTLRDLDLAVERNAAGAWSFAPPAPPVAPPRASSSKAVPTSERAPRAFRAERIELIDASLRVTDRTVSGTPAVLDLNALRLSLDRLPTEGPATLELDARVGSATGARLAVRGRLGPLRDDPAAVPVDLSTKLTAIALGDLRRFLPALGNLDVSRATAAADLRVSGTFSRQLDVRGDASLTRGTVSFVSPHGDARTLPFDLRVRGDMILHDSAARIELPKLDLELPREDANRVLTLRGSVNAVSEPARIDIELLPTRVAADDLAALAALLAPDAPLSFASPDPVALELRARGSLGGGSLPDLEGRATLSGFTFRVAGMTQPMERVGARVTFSPNRIALDELGGVIGKSDVTASRVVVTNFAAPKVQVALDSQNADFWELFSFIESAEAPPGGAPPAGGNDALSRIAIEGTLRIARGALQTLNFDSLTSGMDVRGGVLTLAPLEMNLYGGRFAGKLVQDLNTGVLTINGNGAGIDADGFLAQNLALGGLISGRASTELNVQVVASDPANLLAGVSGGGPLQLVDGRLAKLDVLKTLSRVTGIFGERSLQRLARQLATAGTPFRRAETRLSFDSGTLVFEDLVIETAELTLAGRAALESATGKLEGRFAVAFSAELSAAMRDEQSRAAGLFWDPRAQRVSFGFGVGGLATAPRVSVDWDAALRGVAERKLGERLRALLERKLGAGQPGSAGTATGEPPPPTAPGTSDTGSAPAPTTGGSAGASSESAASNDDPAPDASNAAPSDTAAPGPPPNTGGATPTAPAAGGLLAEITRARWTGPVLLRDLSLEGTVRGAGIDRAALAIVDAGGVEVRRIDRLPTVADQLAAVGDRDAEATVPWTATIDGKRLLVARFPVQVTLTVFDRQGRSASATRAVER